MSKQTHPNISMAVSLHIPYLPEDIPFSVQVIAASLILVLIYIIHSTLTAERPYKEFPVIELSEEGLGPEESWFKQGQRTIQKGLETCTGPFQVITGTGPKICVPNRFAEELKNRDELSLAGAFKKDFFGGYPGFEPFGGLFNENGNDTSIIPEGVREKLTPSLGLITNDFVGEAK